MASRSVERPLHVAAVILFAAAPVTSSGCGGRTQPLIRGPFAEDAVVAASDTGSDTSQSDTPALDADVSLPIDATPDAIFDAALIDVPVDVPIADVAADVPLLDVPPALALRLLAPLSTATVTSHRPTLRWISRTPMDSVRISLCRDRAMSAGCITPLEVNGGSVRVPNALDVGPWFWRVDALAGGVPTGETTPVWEFVAAVRDAFVDSSWGTFPDVDGDGRADVIIASASDPGLWGYFGPITSSTPTPDRIWTGPGSTWRTSRIFSAGDLDGDGFADIATLFLDRATAARTFEIIPGGPAGASGAAIVLDAAPGVATDLWLRTCAPGDLNGDGYADLVAAEGAYGIYEYFGGPGGLSSTPSALPLPAAHFGVRLALTAPGDIDGDGYADVVLSWPDPDTFTWTLYTYLGGPAGLPSAPTSVLRLDSGGADLAGPAGDIDGDGYADFVLGIDDEVVPGESFSVLRGGPTGLGAMPASATWVEQTRSDFAVGDVDGDGYDDVVVSIDWPEVMGYSRGAPSGLAPTVRRLAWPTGLVSPAGDVDADGYDDVIIGVAGGGRALLFRGGVRGLGDTAAVVFTPPLGAGAGFGAPVM